MVTIEEQRAQLIQRRQEIETAQQQLQQARPQLTAQQLRSIPQLRRKQFIERFQREKTTSLGGVQEALAEQRQLETGFETSVSTYESSLARYNAAAREAAEWDQAYSLLSKGKSFAAGTYSIKQKIQKLRDMGYTTMKERELATQSFLTQKKAYEAQQADLAALQEELQMSIDPKLYFKQPQMSIAPSLDTTIPKDQFGIPLYSSKIEQDFFETHLPSTQMSYAPMEIKDTKPFSQKVIEGVRDIGQRGVAKFGAGVGVITSVPLTFDIKEKSFVSLGEVTRETKEGLQYVGQQSATGWEDILSRVGLETKKTVPAYTLEVSQRASAPTRIEIPETEQTTFFGAIPTVARYGPEAITYLAAPGIALGADVAVGAEKLKTIDVDYEKELERQYKEHLKQDLPEDYRYLTEKEFETSYGPQLRESLRKQALVEIALPAGILATAGAIKFWRAGTRPIIQTKTFKPEVFLDEAKVTLGETPITRFKITTIKPPPQVRITTGFREDFGMKPKFDWAPLGKPSVYETQPFLGRAVVGEQPYLAQTTKVSPRLVVPRKLKSIIVTPEEYATSLVKRGKLAFQEAKYLGKGVRGAFIESTSKSIPKIKILQSLKGTARQETIAHELTHFKTPKFIFRIEDVLRLPHKYKPSEIFAYKTQASKALTGYKIGVLKGSKTKRIVFNPVVPRLAWIGGRTKPILPEEVFKLPKAEQYAWFGRGPKVISLREGGQLSESVISSTKWISSPGKSTQSFYAASKVEPIVLTEGGKGIYSIATAFKETTKPFYRATGKLPILRGRLIDYGKINIPTPSGVKVFTPSGGPKTPLSLTFQEQVQSIGVKAVPKPSFVPKKVPKSITAETEELPYMVGGAGLKTIPYAGTGLYERTPSVEGVLVKDVAKVSTTTITGVKPVQQPKFISRVKVDYKTMLAPKVIQKFTPITIVSSGIKSKVKVLQKIVPKLAIKLKTLPKTKVAPKRVPVSVFKPRPTPGRPKRPIKRPVLRPFKFGEKKKKKKKKKKGEVLYIPEVKRYGRWLPFGKFSTQERAEIFGKAIVFGTLGASLRLKRGQEIIPIAKTSPQFRPSKVDVRVLVQRRGKRLSSIGERAEIKAAKKAGGLYFR